MANHITEPATNLSDLRLHVLDEKKSISLKEQHVAKKQADLAVGYTSDRRRLLDQLLPEEKLDSLILHAMERGESSFTVHLDKSAVQSNFWNPKAAISKQVLRELNEHLKSSTMLTRAEYVIDYRVIKLIGQSINDSTALIPVQVLSGFVYYGAIKAGVSAITSAVSMGAVPTLSLYAIAAYTVFKATQKTGQLMSHHIGGNLYDRNEIKIHFKNPNKPWIGISGRAMTALSTAAIAVKDVIAARLQDSPEIIQQFKSEFCNNFRAAVEATIVAEKNLADQAVKQDPDFSLDVERLAQLSSRHIELIEATRYGAKPVLGERTVLTTLENLTADMNNAAKMVNLQPEVLAKISDAFDAVVQDIDLRVQDEESKQSLAIIGNLDFGTRRLAERALQK